MDREPYSEYRRVWLDREIQSDERFIDYWVGRRIDAVVQGQKKPNVFGLRQAISDLKVNLDEQRRLDRI